MTPVEVGLGFQGDKSPPEYEELAQLAERGGADVVAVYQDLFFQPAIYPLLLMARATERDRQARALSLQTTTAGQWAARIPRTSRSRAPARSSRKSTRSTNGSKPITSGAFATKFESAFTS